MSVVNNLTLSMGRVLRIISLFIIIASTFIFCGESRSAEEYQEPPKPLLPDLNVTYISQRPLYHGYWIEYPDNVPTFWVPDKDSPDGKRSVSKEEFQKLVKYQHAEGDKVTFFAHVRNNGFAPSQETEYRMYIDDKLVSEGKIKALDPDEETPVKYEWIWKDGLHTISMIVDPDNKIEEISKINNRLTDPTHGIGLTIRAGDEENYRGFRSTKNLWGTYSFEDWCQAHIHEWRKAFREAIYPATPQGVLQGIRFDGIYTSLEDPALVELRQALRDSITRFGREHIPDPNSWVESESCSWRIYWRIEDIPNYAKKIDRGLIHELCHQCGIIDIYQFGMHLKSNLVSDPEGKFLWVAEGCYRQFGCLMAVWGENPDALPQRGLFREHTAAAFNIEMGKPRWAFGLYLFDLPKNNVLRILDNRGNPIEGATVKLYQQEIDTRTVGKIPPKTGITDSNGEWNMGANPIDKIHVVGTNGIMLFEIQAYGQWEYHTLVISEMNVAYWRGNHDRYVYEMLTGIAPTGSIPAPENLSLEPLSKDKARLTWEYPDKSGKVSKFVVMKRKGHIGIQYDPPFTEIVAETWAHENSVEVDIEAKPRVLFNVVAVDQMGNRSGYSNIAVYPEDEILPEVDRVWAAVQTPDGAIYTLNSDVATIYGLSPTGARLSFADTIRFDAPEIVACMASDKDGILYIPNHKTNVIHKIDPSKPQKLDDIKLSQTEKPRGIAFDSEDNIYLTDIGNHKVHILSKDGKHIASFGGADIFISPRNIHVSKTNSIYVVDCEINKQNFRISDGAIRVFKRKSGSKWEYEPGIVIDGLQYTECVHTDDEGRIYVGGSGGIHVFDEEGTKLAQWSSKPYGTPAGAEFVFSINRGQDGNLIITQGFTLRQILRLRLEEIFKQNN